MEYQANQKFDEIFGAYPKKAQTKLKRLRKLVVDVAKKTEGVDRLEEDLKWGEPSFVTKTGSTFRIDWKEKAPQQVAMYFQCTSRLVETFKVVFDKTFLFEGNRAIVLPLNEKLPENELEACIRTALRYHKVKKHALLELV